MVVWGYCGNTNEASNYTVDFSTDGGLTYEDSETVQTNSLLNTGHAQLNFSTSRRANWVRVTMTNNADGRGFAGVGGDRVGLGEIKFIGSIIAMDSSTTRSISAKVRRKEKTCYIQTQLVMRLYSFITVNLQMP